jgi:hypothetical protein
MKCQAGFEAGAATTGDGGAVGFVERAFEDQVQLRITSAEIDEFLGDSADNLLVFQRAGAGENKKALGIEERHGVKKVASSG